MAEAEENGWIRCERSHEVKVGVLSGRLVVLYVNVDGRAASLSLLDPEVARELGDALEAAAVKVGAPIRAAHENPRAGR
jgi:hypothetical protein